MKVNDIMGKGKKTEMKREEKYLENCQHCVNKEEEE
jgi:hypothetical protein